jgi:hypothetical protein
MDVALSSRQLVTQMFDWRLDRCPRHWLARGGYAPTRSLHSHGDVNGRAHRDTPAELCGGPSLPLPGTATEWRPGGDVADRAAFQPEVPWFQERAQCPDWA